MKKLKFRSLQVQSHLDIYFGGTQMDLSMRQLQIQLRFSEVKLEACMECRFSEVGVYGVKNAQILQQLCLHVSLQPLGA